MHIRAEHIQAILANPFYAITIAPQLVADHEVEMRDEEWVQANARLMQDLGVERWLWQVLDFLQSADETWLADPHMNPYLAVNIAPVFAQEHEPMWSQETWVQANVRLIQEMGVESWLRQWLDILEGDFVTTDEIIPLTFPGTSPHKGKHGKLRRKRKKRRGF